MVKIKNIGKAIKTKNGYRFVKEFWGQGHVYKFMGDLDKVSNDYPIYSAEYQDNEYETKATLKKLVKGTKIDWRFIFEMLDWACAETLFLELTDCDWFVGE
jgi:hypothetical protein